MTNLVFINNNNEVVTDSLMVAEVFDKEHKHVMRDIENQTNKLLQADESEFVASNFGLISYKDTLNRDRMKATLTEDAFMMVAMSYVTVEAMKMKVKFIEEFKKMKEYIQKQQKPKSAIEQIQRLLMEGTVELNKRVDVLEDKLDNRMTIDYQQQRQLQNVVEGRVRHLWNNGTPMGRMTKKQLFSKAYRRLKDRYGTSSYKDILVKDFDEAMKYVKDWKGE
ncbi:Rha family transcriptional regulator [Bacillus sp. COPE52]|uniref:Rha family transcriptional regulator n=1 Tax=Bacillus sp. COPE52 TaxID=2233998 RepID=UPI000E10A7EF|nr:Rha family transcriptional regulator [Bacillus sp. COPE52]AXK19151.1 transcriptional regulator [Bacillus sp. COPE52]